MHHDVPVSLAEAQTSLPERGLWPRLPLVAGGLGALFLVVSFILGRGSEQFYRSYLVAYLFFLSVALGGLFFVLLQHLTRAGWSIVVRRLAEHVMGTLPLFAVLFLPIAFGYHDLFHWSHPEAVAADPLLQHKSPYLNSGFFFGRAVFFFAAWTLLAWFFRSQSARQDTSGDLAISQRLKTLSAPGMVLFAVTLNFAAFDWIMSLDPHWFSTIFGVYFFAGSVLAILATLILMAEGLQKAGSLHGVVTGEHYYDLGKLLFAFVVFWAYIGFSQFMLIWYANIPEETVWFDHRWHEGWKPVSIFLAAGHFGLPFLFLLSEKVKRRTATRVAASIWLLGMHFVDLHWLVMPNFSGFNPHPLDILCFIALGGLFLGTLGWLMRRRPLVPLRDPRLAESLVFESV